MPVNQLPSKEEMDDLDRRDREAAHAVRYLALHVLSFAESATVLHEAQALAENRAVSMDERVVLYEKWRRELWLACQNQGGLSFEQLQKQLDSHGVVVPERLAKQGRP